MLMFTPKNTGCSNHYDLKCMYKLKEKISVLNSIVNSVMKVSYLIDEGNPPSILNRRVLEIDGALNHAYMTAIELNSKKNIVQWPKRKQSFTKL